MQDEETKKEWKILLVSGVRKWYNHHAMGRRLHSTSGGTSA